MRWNPANCTIAFEYIETFKVEKQLEEFYELTKKQFKYAYKAQDVGRCFRNLGYYYIEKNEYSIAATCYVVSKLYDCENQFADSQLYYIEHTAPDGYEVPTVELLKKYVCREVLIPMLLVLLMPTDIKHWKMVILN